MSDLADKINTGDLVTIRHGSFKQWTVTGSTIMTGNVPLYSVTDGNRRRTVRHDAISSITPAPPVEKAS